jgi:hypothetical protein
MKTLYSKIKKASVLSLLLMLSTTACKKSFLTENNLSGITQSNYFTTAAQAQASVTGIYPGLQTFTSEEGYLGEAAWASIEFPVGHLASGGSSLYNNALIKHTNSSLEPVFRTVWVGFYNGIANANLAINRIPGITMNTTTQKALLGQAYFLRALYYYYLVRLYGDIPLITAPVDFASPDLNPARAPVEKVYQLIVSDLQQAENSGLPNVDVTGKASLGAVKSLLASVYLTMAGNPLNKGAAYYQLAADKAKEVIDGKYYSLFPNYAYLHDRAHKNQGELIFQVQYLTGVKTNRLTEFITPSQAGISKLTGEIGSVVPTNEFVSSYEPNDKRVQEQQFYFTQALAKGSTTRVVKFGEYALYKFWLNEAAGPSGDLNDDENWTLLRYPEVLLIYAEASNEISGPTQAAYDQINLIRTRANLPPLSGLSKTEFREAIWRERYHELAYENKSYFDVQRTRQVYNLSTGHFVDAFSYHNQTGATFNQQYLLWPLPQSELYVNPNLKPQNPGW